MLSFDKLCLGGQPRDLSSHRQNENNNEQSEEIALGFMKVSLPVEFTTFQFPKCSLPPQAEFITSVTGSTQSRWEGKE